MVNVMVERATDDSLIGSDWAMNLEICDLLNRDPSEAKDVVKGIKKKLGSKNPKVQLLTLTLLETLVKNCGDIVHLHVAEKDVLHELVRIVKKKPDTRVKNKILIMIDTCQEAFGGPRARYPQYYAAYQELLRAGVVFPLRSESEAPVFTPPQTQPLSTYPPNVRNSDFPQEVPTESSSQSQFSSLSLSTNEVQNALGIMEVLSEMLSALEQGNKEGLKQEVIVDLVGQCRTYKERVVHLVTNTGDETLMFQGLALSDELDRVLEKHDVISTGVPLRVEQPKTKPAQKSIPVDSLLIDMRDNGKRPTSSATSGVQAEPPLLALPAPAANTSTPPMVKLDPKIDLLSGDDYNSPTAENNMALVPLGEVNPLNPLSNQNALVLIDFYSEGIITSSSSIQSSFLTGETQPPTMPFNQQHNLSSSQSQQQNPLTSNGSDPNSAVALNDQSSYSQSESLAWNGQQQSSASVHGQNERSFPPPPWETQPDEGNMQADAQYPEMYVHIHTQVMETVPYGQQNGILYPQGEYMIVNQPLQNNQYAGMQQPQQQTDRILPGQMYPQQMQGYGYSNGFGQQDPRLMQQQMTGVSMSGNNNVGKMNNNPYTTSSASKPKNLEDKLFGDLVDMSKFRSAKSTAG